MAGSAVEYLQRRLGIGDDGKFGDDTEAAVKAFQAKWMPEFFANGVVGKDTMFSIEAHPPGKAPAVAKIPAAKSSSVAITKTSASSVTVQTKAPFKIAGFPLWIVGGALVALALIGTGIYLGVRPSAALAG